MLKLYNGNCLEVMRTMQDNSVDSIVTDPPYGMSKEPNIAEVMTHWINGDDYVHKGGGFMGKSWDSFVPGPSIWKEALRVLKPGGHILCFASTRTQDLMGISLRFAGFEIKDTVQWMYGSGFPKRLNIGKQLSEYTGYGTTLKPAHEPIILARKPLSEKTIVSNVLKHGTGGINIDGCRVGTESVPCFTSSGGRKFEPSDTQPERSTKLVGTHDKGRFPANLIHDGSEEVVSLFPKSSHGSGGRKETSATKAFSTVNSGPNNTGEFTPYSDAGEGSASRFFYCAKASKLDRDSGLNEFPEIHRVNGNKWTDQDYRVSSGERPSNAESGPRKNIHPTVKPQSLMQYLCKLITPPDGIILDPFMGSGSTGKGAKLEGFGFIGIELDQDYFNIAEARINTL